MILKRTLLSAIAVQAIGAVATLLATVIVSRRYGADGQGHWANFKSIVDLLTVLCAYGFPHSFPFFMNARGVSADRLFGISRKYFLAVVPALLAGLYAAVSTGLLRLEVPSSHQVPVLALSVLLLSWHAILRGMSLSAFPPSGYNLVTIMPAVVLCGLLYGWPSGALDTLPWAMVLSGAVSYGLPRVLWHRYASPAGPAAAQVLQREVFSYGLGIFASNLAAASIAVLVYQMLRWQGATAETIGQMSIGLLVLGAAVIPASMAGPFLFNAWSRDRAGERVLASYVQVGRWTLIWAAAVWLVAFLSISWAIPIVVGPGFAEAVPLSQVLLASVPLAYWLRVAGQVLISAGWVGHHAAMWIIRAAMTGALLLAGMDTDPLAAAWSWVIGELTGLAVSLFLVKRLTGWAWQSVLLLSAKS